jgi:hypothetical protein
MIQNNNYIILALIKPVRTAVCSAAVRSAVRSAVRCSLPQALSIIIIVQ